MKKSKAKKAGLRAFVKKAKAAKGTGPSKRTPAQRAAIDKRAAIASRDAKGEQRTRAKKEGALKVSCPTCRAQPGAPCFDRHGRTVLVPHVARVMTGKGFVPKPLAAALAPLVSETAGNKGRRAAEGSGAATHKGRDSWAKPGTARETIDAQRMRSFGVTHYSPHADLIDPAQIIIGTRHRTEFGDLKALAKSIDDRGGLIQPIALTAKRELIAGERRLRAWALSRFAGQKIPCHYLDVDAIVAGEWDENAQRKDFTPSEAVKIKRTLEDVLAKLKASRPAAQKPAPGRKASGEGAGRTDDKIGKLTGVGRDALRKAAAVVEAAERDPEKFGDLQAEMDRTGKVNSAHKKLAVREAKEKINAAPPPLPMNLAECGTVSIDFPWAGEMHADQDKLDAKGRAFRPYPEMSIKTVCKFATDEIAPKLAAKVSVWLWVTNFILVRGYHNHVIQALGFKPENASTMLTWDKVEIGRGQILREQTEHAILLTRGKPLIDVFGENPPTTLIREPRRENSRKPECFYRLVERVTPAKRYAAIFSQGGEGALWDSHGDQVGKFAPAIARAAEQEVIAEAKGEELAEIEPWRFQLAALLRVEMNATADISDIDATLYAGLIEGERERKLTDRGRARLVQLNSLSRLDQLDKVANGRGDDLTSAAREQLQTLGYVVGKAKRLTKYGEKERLRLRDFRESFFAIKAVPAAIVAPVEPAALVDENECPGHVASDGDPKVCARCGCHIDSLRPDAETAPVDDAAPFDERAERFALAQIDAGNVPAREDATMILARRGLVHVGTKSVRLTNLGVDRLAVLNTRGGAVAADGGAPEPAQIDLEEAIAAKAGVQEDIPPFLRRRAEATA